jgi:hypothetical protein
VRWKEYLNIIVVNVIFKVLIKVNFKFKTFTAVNVYIFLTPYCLACSRYICGTEESSISILKLLKNFPFKVVILIKFSILAIHFRTRRIFLCRNNTVLVYQHVFFIAQNKFFFSKFLRSIVRVEAYINTRWFKYDRDYLCVNKSQFVPVIFEPPCICKYR